MTLALYPYQQRVKDLIQSGRSVILRAPTGTGKTRTALAPFIEDFFEKPRGMVPHKCLYVVPRRVLANQFHREYQSLATSYDRRFRRDLRVTIQTGEQPQDPRFEMGDLTFCTIDQFLSSYLTMPYGLPARLANLNAGALPGAYIVFDEFHLLDPGSTLPTTLYALQQLKSLAPALLMTATFSPALLEMLAKTLGAEVVEVPRDEIRSIQSQNAALQVRERTWHMSDNPLSAVAVWAAHQKRSLALCNTVGRAQALYRDLRELAQAAGGQVRVMLLHSRFLPRDRREIEDDLRRLFGTGEGADGSGSVIVVATQVIEVGVDITSEALHTELAPASALIQRAGRCARYPGEHGQVTVYPVDNYLPYGREAKDAARDGPWVAEMKAARVWLADHTGQALDSAQEQAFVDAVAAERDRQMVSALTIGRVSRAQDIQRVLNGDRSAADGRLLVRDVQSRLVLIHSAPEQLVSDPYGAIGFNLSLDTLGGMVRGWLDREGDLEWSVQGLQEHMTDDNRAEYSWARLPDAQLVAQAKVLVVHPDLAGYSREEGFLHDVGGSGFESTMEPAASKRTWDGFSYRLESYEDHVACVVQAFEALALPELLYPAQALDRAAGWLGGSTLRAAWLACLLHDVGKLSRGWQGWAHAYQAAIGEPAAAGMSVAHTTSVPGNEAHRLAGKAVQKTHPRPNHAAESALAVSAILAKALDGNEPLAKAALTAIVRHHTPFARECSAYALEKTAMSHIVATLACVPVEVRQSLELAGLRPALAAPNASFATMLVEPGDMHGWLAYTLLARALRRADQAGTSRGSK